MFTLSIKDIIKYVQKHKTEVIIKTAIVVGIVLLIVLFIHIVKNSSIETAYTTGTVTDKEHEVWYTTERIKNGDDYEYHRRRHENWNVSVITESGIGFTEDSRSAYRKVVAGQTVKVKISMWYYKSKLMTTSYHIELEGD